MHLQTKNLLTCQPAAKTDGILPAGQGNIHYVRLSGVFASFLQHSQTALHTGVTDVLLAHAYVYATMHKILLMHKVCACV